MEPSLIPWEAHFETNKNTDYSFFCDTALVMAFDTLKRKMRTTSFTPSQAFNFSITENILFQELGKACGKKRTRGQRFQIEFTSV